MPMSQSEHLHRQNPHSYISKALEGNSEGYRF